MTRLAGRTEKMGIMKLHALRSMIRRTHLKIYTLPISTKYPVLKSPAYLICEATQRARLTLWQHSSRLLLFISPSSNPRLTVRCGTVPIVRHLNLEATTSNHQAPYFRLPDAIHLAWRHKRNPHICSITDSAITPAPLTRPAHTSRDRIPELHI